MSVVTTTCGKHDLEAEKCEDWDSKKPTTGHFIAEGHTHQGNVQHHAQEPLQHPPR